MPDTLRFGVIGLGRAGSGMVGALAKHPDIQLTAAADRYQQHLDKFSANFGGHTFTDGEDLCKSPEVDAVYIATPHELHAAHVQMAAEHGKHIIVEKPMALTLEDCDRMIETIDRTGVKMIVGHTASYNPGIQKMRELIVSGEVGRLGMISAAAYTDFLYRPRRPEELVTELGGGIIFNQVPHQVDAVRFLAGGMVRSVRALTWDLDSNRHTEGAYMGMLEFENGAGASLVYSGYDHFESSQLAGGSANRAPEDYGKTRRTLGVRTPEDEIALRVDTGYGGERGRGGDGGGRESFLQGELGSFIVSCEGADLRLTAEGVLAYTNDGFRQIPVTPFRGVPGRGNVIDELYYAVTENRPLVHDGRWAKASMEVCLGFLQSAREHEDMTMRYQIPTVDLSLRKSPT